MAQLEWVDLRLKNWALWRRGGQAGGIGYASTNILAAQGGGAGGSAYREAVVPIDGPEAKATDEAVRSLEPELQQVVAEWYLEPGPAATIAAHLQVAERTLYARLERSQHAIAEWFTVRRERQEAERDRIQKLQREANRRP